LAVPASQISTAILPFEDKMELSSFATNAEVFQRGIEKRLRIGRIKPELFNPII